MSDGRLLTTCLNGTSIRCFVDQYVLIAARKWRDVMECGILIGGKKGFRTLYIKIAVVAGFV